MWKTVSVAIAIGAASIAAAAHAGCQFKSERVVGCFPRNGNLAAQVFEQFGFDGEAMERPNVRAVLAQAGCRVIRSRKPGSFKIYLVGSWRVATMQDWRKIDLIDVATNSGLQPFEIAADYIVGTCDRPPPPTVHTLPPD